MSDVVLVTAWLSVWSKVQSAYGPANATATSSYLASLKSKMVNLSGAGSPRWKRGHKTELIFTK